jgi:hypothetical protein
MKSERRCAASFPSCVISSEHPRERASERERERERERDGASGAASRRLRRLLHYRIRPE